MLAAPPRLTPAAEARIRHGLTVETVYSPQAAEAIRLLLAEVEALRGAQKGPGREHARALDVLGQAF